MLQYLLNATAIWLLSLILFDLFLRKESYHSYNRTYLLSTLLFGALLPLWEGATPVQDPFHPQVSPVQQVIAVKQTIAASTPSLPDTVIDWTQWLTIIYLLGVTVALAILVIDVVKLSGYYRSGRRSVQDKWTVIETVRGHAPFSFRNTLFVNSITQYSADEWQMILLHEKRHTTLLHVADLLLLHLARIVFWFHPLVYAYSKRLLMVHEYQADNASSQHPRLYGQFLVEQSMLQSAPALSHSFNRSPIKNRIVMLTRRSSTPAKIKMLLLLPLSAICFILFTKTTLVAAAKDKLLPKYLKATHSG